MWRLVRYHSSITVSSAGLPRPEFWFSPFSGVTALAPGSRLPRSSRGTWAPASGPTHQAPSVRHPRRQRALVSLLSSSASLDFYHVLGSGAARLPVPEMGFTFGLHTAKLDFLSPATSTGTCQANYASFVIKTLRWCLPPSLLSTGKVVMHHHKPFFFLALVQTLLFQNCLVQSAFIGCL